MNMISAESAGGCGSHRAGGWSSFHLLYSVLLLWSEQMHGLSDFSNYLFRIIISHSAHARDGELLLLSCPRHSSISVQSAFYRSHAPLTHCNAPTALQKMLSECQGWRNCQVLVNYRQFGSDPCPGTTKHLHVTYSCKPTENKNRTRCEGDKMLLHCKYPKLLNIYSAVYGRELGEKPACLTETETETEKPPPFECLYHGAVDTVKNLCYGKQRCLFIINDQRFRNPCLPDTKKYLSVAYSCVPQSLLKEADPNLFQTTTIPLETTKSGKRPDVRESRFPVKNSFLLSNSLMAYGYIKEHPERAGLLFVSSVCLGLFLVLLAISLRITCSRHLKETIYLNKKPITVEPDDDDDGDDDSDEESEPLMESSMMSEVGRKVYCWEEAMYTTEAAELIERLERREMIIQEIRMNAYLNGTSCTLH